MIPRDDALPQLATVLDGPAMGHALAPLVGGLQLRGCDVERVKYRPGRSCSVVYRLDLRDMATGRAIEQRVAVRACPPGTSARRHEQALARARVPSAAGPAVSHLPALALVAHWLPNDARLTVLPLLADDEALRAQVLPEVVAALTDGRGRLLSHRCTLAHLVPELRVCARVDLEVDEGRGAAMHTVYAKADVERSGQATHAAMAELASSAAQAGGLLHTPRPLCWQAGPGLHWQAAVAGTPLQALQPQPGALWSARVGRRLAALHATAVPGLPVTGVDTLHTHIEAAAELLGRADSAWRQPAARLATRLQAGSTALAGLPVVTLHGDLHPGNVLVDGDRTHFIDLDSLHAGAAVLELGAWVSDALVRAVLAGLPLHDAVRSARACLQAYAEAGGDTADPALLAWSTAYDLVCKRACRGVANLKPGRWQAVPTLLALAATLLATARLQSLAAPAQEAA